MDAVLSSPHAEAYAVRERYCIGGQRGEHQEAYHKTQPYFEMNKLLALSASSILRFSTADKIMTPAGVETEIPDSYLLLFLVALTDSSKI